MRPIILAIESSCDETSASVIKNGIKGEMPRFNQKLQDDDVQLLIHFLHSLKRMEAASN